MKTSQRRFLTGCTALMLALMATPGMAQQRYPSKPITIIVPFPAGTTDTFSRVMGRRFSESMGQPVIIENRAGAEIGRAHV